MTNETAAEPTGHDISYYLDIAIALLLGIAATATAWSAYQSSLFGGDEAEAFHTAGQKTTQAALTTDQASQAWTEGDQTYIQDQQLFLEYVKAAQACNPDNPDDANCSLVAYLRTSLMSPELVAGIAWWEQQPDSGPQTPFDDSNPDYTNASYDTAAGLDDDSQALLDEASASNEKANKLGDTGDKYDFVTVILASALFLLGIAGVFRELPVKIGMSGIGAIFLALALVQLIGLDRA